MKNTTLLRWLCELLVRIVQAMLRPAPRLPGSKSRELRRQWQEVQQFSDPYRQIMEADAVIGQLLMGLGFGSSFGEALKNRPQLIPNLQDVWRAHKLRNTLAHEPGTSVTIRDAQFVIKTFQPLVDKFCSK
jgi:hypothetical protein